MARRPRVRDTNNIPKAIRRWGTLRRLRIFVGVFGESGQDLVTYARANEFGVPGRSRASSRWRIPPRSFLRSTVNEKRRAYAALLRAATDRILDGADIETEANLIIQRVVRDVRRKIVALKIPINAPSTVRRKGSSNPLVDTGRLLQSIAGRMAQRLTGE